jgi:2-polyprenyl-3-methyl-5-hydroxy-6-metoxy-1,4-benzoquinol methylase
VSAVELVPPGACPVCEERSLARVFHWDRPPNGETVFRLPPGSQYAREFWSCTRCGHFTGVSSFDLAALYEGGYVDAKYTADGLQAAYQRVMALPPEASDNFQRVRRITSFLSGAASVDQRDLLDVGSGLCVFAARMKDEGWRCTVLDPDPRAAAHARDRVGVEAVQGDFMRAEPFGRFQLVTLNKVLEHVSDPVAMLERTRGYLRDGGVTYVEVPDGEAASLDDPGREEFFVEHLHAFSAASLALTALRAGYAVQRLDRLREPSTKYTLVAFLRERAA